nr:hypothetical protein [Mycoplasmopsis bovis]
MIKEKNLAIREHCSSSIIKETGAFSADLKIGCIILANNNYK